MPFLPLSKCARGCLFLLCPGACFYEIPVATGNVISYLLIPSQVRFFFAFQTKMLPGLLLCPVLLSHDTSVMKSISGSHSSRLRRNHFLFLLPHVLVGAVNLARVSVCECFYMFVRTCVHAIPIRLHAHAHPPTVDSAWLATLRR